MKGVHGEGVLPPGPYGPVATDGVTEVVLGEHQLLRPAVRRGHPRADRPARRGFRAGSFRGERPGRRRLRPLRGQLVGALLGRHGEGRHVVVDRRVGDLPAVPGHRELEVPEGCRGLVAAGVVLPVPVVALDHVQVRNEDVTAAAVGADEPHARIHVLPPRQLVRLVGGEVGTGSTGGRWPPRAAAGPARRTRPGCRRSATGCRRSRRSR